MQPRSRVQPGPGQESVWDYPRPPAVEPVRERVTVEFGGTVVVDTTDAVRVLETSHPPTIYVPPADVRAELLAPSAAVGSFCEFKGVARYFDVVVGSDRRRQAAWAYPSPSPGYAALRDHVAFYPGRADAAWLDEERVTAQEGDFYGGWISAGLGGPFKGAPGTSVW